MTPLRVTAKIQVAAAAVTVLSTRNAMTKIQVAAAAVTVLSTRNALSVHIPSVVSHAFEMQPVLYNSRKSIVNPFKTKSKFLFD
jgi:hypothetical protein